MLLKEYILNLGGVDKLCDIYLNGITRTKFLEQFKSNKDLITHSFKKLSASKEFLLSIKNAQTYEEIHEILTKVKGGHIKWN